MRILKFIITAAVTIALIAVLDMKIGSTPPVGKLLSPSHGLWKNAEPSDYSFSSAIISNKLQGEVSVSLDERLVPHVFAKDDHDAYFVQGYLHAKFRLWQMDFQAYAAAGRLSEILGDKLGDKDVLDGHDRKFRRLGMVYAAENTLQAINADPVAKNAVDAYTEGANLYISSLKPEDYPIEYKLLDYAPELWTPLKTALIFKYMSYDLTADLDDFEYTNVRKQLGLETYNQLFPFRADSISPVIPKGNVFASTGKLPVKPAGVDSILFQDSNTVAINATNRDPDNGSNNWVVSGNKTASGRPILCNDPHLGLNLPSLWYEIQINTPEYNVYGVSLPGTPSVTIGFNDSIAWGITNASRDVMDFYETKFKDSTMDEYWYDSAWQKTDWRNEVIHVRGKADFVDTLAITIWGPVMYDADYENNFKDGKSYAVKWTAHEPSADVKVSIALNKARNYNEFLEAIKPYSNPAQNLVFASKKNNIALWQAGSLPAKWQSQGDFVMPGWDSTFKWQAFIPFEDKLHELNPERGYLSSANQIPADTNYPYYLGGSYDLYRSIIINRMLSKLDSSVTVDDMMKMQTSTYNVFAEFARPVIIKYVDEYRLSHDAKTLLATFKAWDLNAGADETGMTIFDNWWNAFSDTVWQDDIKPGASSKVPIPADQTLLEGIMRDSTAYRFIDNISTTQIETLPALLAESLNKVAKKLTAKPQVWSDYQATRLTHLLKIPAFNDMNLHVGGGRKIINCIKQDHGPSWRMIVQLTDETEAYGVYPGGQQGNPGSKYYLQFADKWAAGEYYRLWIMKSSEANSDKVKWKMTFKKA
ncbi:penicillin acylase family protein [soil metagenome]